MRVLITGATGMIGQEVVKLCHQSGIRVNYLTTSKSKIVSEGNYQGFYWNPAKGDIDAACFDDVEVIINLVGATIAKRWTPKYRKEIINSRVQSTNLLRETLINTKHSIRQIVSASAIGIYPSSLQNYYRETSSEKDFGFLGDVVNKWEYSVEKFNALDIDVCILRIGLVLASKGGAYPKIAKPIKYGLGAVFGSGKQWQSWIHIDDLAAIFLFAVEQELIGVFNAVAPNPVTNHKLTHCTANELDKTIYLPRVPKFAMALLLGKMHRLLFDSQRVSADKIQEAGYSFIYDNLPPAVKDLVQDI
ncbi:TIGR01777 family oxidoreductase [Aquimarina brevivitae]|uniref:TIGR01777 family protein n=1 Tax=Aquimarina brevivitae TaxID=323412 RepID=A0A4Q7PK49_9FLAO|nr:TIGR01777 family oxidoreductase [Aquimarina brevivitae]RZT00221.1 hypothetical protein EV197_1457 [Aquimarina brevivitae]